MECELLNLFPQSKAAELSALKAQLEQVSREYSVVLKELQRLQALLKNASQAIQAALQVTSFTLHTLTNGLTTQVNKIMIVQHCILNKLGRFSVCSYSNVTVLCIA